MDSAIINHFRHTDPILARLTDLYGDTVQTPSRKLTTHFLEELCETIVGQQLSVKAAATIWSRAKLLANDWSDPNQILAISDLDLRAAGLSNQKTIYVKNIARGVLNGTLQLDHYLDMPEKDIINQLTQIKGIGVWTAEMFLIFTLGRQDVFSTGDLGLRNAVQKLYGGMSLGDMARLSETWSPYRSYASLLLWKSLDNEPKKK